MLRRHAGFGAVATVVLALAIILVMFLWRRVDSILEQRYRRRIEALSEKTFQIVQESRSTPP